MRVIIAVFGAVIVGGCATVPEGMVSLGSVRRKHDLSRLERTPEAIQFRQNGRKLKFYADSRRFLLDNTLVWMNAPAIRNGRRWAVSEADYQWVIAPLLHPRSALRGAKAGRILLDPGHGGTDHGASTPSKTIREKDIVFDLAVRLGDSLQQQGILTALTRERTQFVNLVTRSLSARRWRSDVFVSIHCNSAANKDAVGIETFVLPTPGFPSTSGNRSSLQPQLGNRFDSASIVLAYEVHRRTVESTKAMDRGIKRARWQVLKDAPCPAILVECGFISNEEETKKLGDAAYRQQLADAMAEGIAAYSKQVNDANPFVIPGTNRR